MGWRRFVSCLTQSMEAWGSTSATVLRCQRSWATSAVEAFPWPSVSRRTWLLLHWPGRVPQTSRLRISPWMMVCFTGCGKVWSVVSRTPESSVFTARLKLATCPCVNDCPLTTHTPASAFSYQKDNNSSVTQAQRPALYYSPLYTHAGVCFCWTGLLVVKTKSRPNSGSSDRMYADLDVLQLGTTQKRESYTIQPVELTFTKVLLTGVH